MSKGYVWMRKRKGLFLYGIKRRFIFGLKVPTTFGYIGRIEYDEDIKAYWFRDSIQAIGTSLYASEEITAKLQEVNRGSSFE